MPRSGRFFAGSATLHVFVDRSSVEVFGNDGGVAIMDPVFPGSDDLAVRAYARRGDVEVSLIDVWGLRSIW